MSVIPHDHGQAVAESIRLQLGTDALVVITPGPHSCAVVVSSVPGYLSWFSDARTQLDRESAEDGPRLAYTVTQAARALGLSRSMIYDQLRANRLASVKVGKRRIITRQQIGAWLAGLPTGPPES
jgi:excisionase family DNA binding protein